MNAHYKQLHLSAGAGTPSPNHMHLLEHASTQQLLLQKPKDADASMFAASHALCTVINVSSSSATIYRDLSRCRDLETPQAAHSTETAKVTASSSICFLAASDFHLSKDLGAELLVGGEFASCSPKPNNID